MGWSIDTIRPYIHTIFQELKKKYIITRPESTKPEVIVRYEGRMSIDDMKRIQDLFPPEVYVQFVPNSSFDPDREGDTYEPFVPEVAKEEE